MKLFKDERGEIFLSPTGQVEFLLSFDGEIIIGNKDLYKEVPTTAEKDFCSLDEKTKSFSIGCNLNMDESIKVTMEILRNDKTNKNKRKYEVGDKFSFALKNGESVTALAVKEEADGMVFIFEDCLSKAYSMNDNLMDMLNNELYKLFPDEIQNVMVSFGGNNMIRIPTEKEIFGVNKYGEKESDDVKQFEPMKKRRNRIAFRNDELEWYWLKNRGVGVRLPSLLWPTPVMRTPTAPLILLVFARFSKSDLQKSKIFNLTAINGGMLKVIIKKIGV